MEIQEENNLIQEAFEVEANEVGFCLDQKWGDYENPYENSDTALAFNLFKKGWQAAKSQAVPDGYCVVPKEPTPKMSIAYQKNAIAPVSSLSISGYKAMIEGQEPTND
ncbi:hypothetical protein GQO11_13280 [Acinetobacter johnsonii]|uniref:hypothetical protein n=1 Tax=Acinetobacter johnsonii TaxID=40214 RepID=UPI0013271715|nr:hypothetical protein [Acinetobacter johnsonii]MWC19609.1 hypothetical protein [Acinetobacter johnsonii]